MRDTEYDSFLMEDDCHMIGCCLLIVISQRRIPQSVLILHVSIRTHFRYWDNVNWWLYPNKMIFSHRIACISTLPDDEVEPMIHWRHDGAVDDDLHPINSLHN